MEKYTSLKLSKKLAEAGCKLESDMVWFNMDGEFELVEKLPAMPNLKWYPAYDILNDICIKYRDEMFGKKNSLSIVSVIFHKLLIGDVEGAEKTIESTCIFLKDVV